MKTIQELTTSIEELEKRIRAISTAQSTLSQLTAIREYIANVQNYLSELNQSFDSHTQNCTDYSDAITTIQSQIETINSTLANMSNISNEQITELTTTLNDVSTTLNQFLGTSTTSLETIETDISTLQTEVAIAQDDITDLNTEISAINSSIGEQNTSITNLQTAQTSLQATQTNLQTTLSGQASSLSSINNRLTTCENNVSTLTGGVDVSEIDNRITDLENGDTNPPTCCHKQYNYHNANSSNNTLYTRSELYSCAKNRMVYQYFKLNYNSTATGTLTITVIEDATETGEVFTFDLSTNPYGCTFFRQFVATKMSHDIQLKIVSSTGITYKTLDFWLFGSNVTIYETNKDVKVMCFDNNIYVSRYVGNELKYGKFASGDDIDLDNLPNTYPLNDTYCFNYAMFAPHAIYNGSGQGIIKFTDECLFIEDGNSNYVRVIKENSETGNISTLNYGSNVSHNSEYVLNNYQYQFVIDLIDSKPKVSIISSRDSYGFSDISKYMPNEWFYANADIDNFMTQQDNCKFLMNVTCVAKYSDNYFYYISGRTAPRYIKLCKGGNSATAYKQKDGSINIYVNFDTLVKKYNVLNNVATFVETIENCTCIYEILDTHLIKRDVANNWTIEPVNTTPTTE